MRWRLIALALAGVLTGCLAGPVDEEEGAHQDALLTADVDRELIVPEALWREAPRGCAGLIADGVVFGRAENAPGLGVAFSSEGELLCVDTWDAIQDLVARFRGDPSPDPMNRWREDLD